MYKVIRTKIVINDYTDPGVPRTFYDTMKAKGAEGDLFERLYRGAD